MIQSLIRPMIVDSTIKELNNGDGLQASNYKCSKSLKAHRKIDMHATIKKMLSATWEFKSQISQD